MRQFEAWRTLFRRAGGRTQIGFPAIGAEAEDGEVKAVVVASSVRPVRFAADRFVLATGGIYGHGLEMDRAGVVSEPIFHLPLRGVPRLSDQGDETRGIDAICAAGVAVDEALRPVDDAGRPVFENLHAAGALLAGGTGPRIGAGDGVAIGTGYAAAQAILAG